MAHNTVIFRIKDYDTDTQLDSIAVHLPTGLTLAQYQTWADALAPELDAVTEGIITAMELNVQLTLTSGLSTSIGVGAQNERGGLIQFSTPIPKKFSFRIPAIRHTIMSGDSFSLADTDIAALVTRLTTTTNSARPVSDFEENLSAALVGKKSQHKR